MRTLTTPRLRLEPIGARHLDVLVELDGDAQVLRHILGRARSDAEAREFWTPQVPGPMWVGYVEDEPVGWWSLWPREGGPPSSATAWPVGGGGWVSPSRVPER